MSTPVDSPPASALAARPPLWPALTLAGSAAVLAGAWGFQLLGGLAPCPLCLYQRWPYWVAIALAGAALVTARRIGARGVAAMTALCALAFLAGAGVAGFHVGVEQGWWQGLAACGGAGGLDDPNLSVEALRERLMATPAVRCDEVPWSLFGISLAGYNLAISLAFAGASLWAARNLWRSRR